MAENISQYCLMVHYQRGTWLSALKTLIFRDAAILPSQPASFQTPVESISPTSLDAPAASQRGEAPSRADTREEANDTEGAVSSQPPVPTASAVSSQAPAASQANNPSARMNTDEEAAE